MRQFLAFLHVLVFSCLLASAQEPQHPSARDTYFLIDTSTSMSRGSNWGDAVATVDQKLADLSTANPAPNVSVNQIAGGPLGCRTPIDIKPATPTTSIELEEPAEGATTLMGPALQKTLEKVGSNTADIFNVTDGAEQPYGPSICEVAAGLRIDDRDIRIGIAFTEDASAGDRARLMTCLSTNPKSTLVTTREREQHALLGAGKEESLVSIWVAGSPLDRLVWLLWLVSPISAAGLAAVIGHGRGKSADEFREATDDIHRLQAELLNPEAQVASAQEALASKVLHPARPTKWCWHQHLLFWAIIVIAIFVPFIVYTVFYLEPGSRIAWAALSSNAAAIFVALFATPVIFAFSQNWRYISNERSHSAAIDSALRTQSWLREQQLTKLHSDAVQKWELLGQIGDKITPPTFRNFNQRRRSPAIDEGQFRVVVNAVLDMFRGAKPERSKATEDNLKKQIADLDELLKKKWTLPELIDSALQREQRESLNPADLRKLAYALRKSDRSQITQLLGALASRLSSQP
jgi:hypothetical protein